MVATLSESNSLKNEQFVFAFIFDKNIQKKYFLTFNKSEAI
jgi:hypothetical protein